MKLTHKDKLYAQALTKVTEELGTIPEPALVNDYEERQEQRRARYEERADKASKNSDDLAERSRNLLPSCGSPILVGHHSEGRHRNAIKRSDNLMRKAVETQNKAEHYERRASNVGKGGISSDDPDAIRKLMLELVESVEKQSMMKELNKLVKSKKLDQAEKETLLIEAGYKERTVKNLFEPDFAGRLGFPSYALQNNNQNMKRIKDRITELKQKQDMQYQTHKYAEGYLVIEVNPDENRVFIRNDEKPSEEIRTIYKRYGFRWSRYQVAWSRKLTGNAIYAAKHVGKEIEELLAEHR